MKSQAFPTAGTRHPHAAQAAATLAREVLGVVVALLGLAALTALNLSGS